ncbi:transposase [Thiotrichales bacterium HSG1]|nr:transposase [Thiotrichales bacterium HSG1]
MDKKACAIINHNFSHEEWQKYKGRSVKGINLLNCLYNVDNISIPVSFELVHKPIKFIDPKTNKEKRRSEVTKNEIMRGMLDACKQNQVKYSWVLFDIWFGSKENFEHIKLKHEKDFISALKGNRLVALSEKDKLEGRFTRIDQIQWSEKEVVTGWLRGMSFPVCLVRQVFTNKDGSNGILYLTCSKLNSQWDEITTIYQKRWKVEVFHKSLKSNSALAKSPARRIVSQSNYIFASIVAVFKMERLKIYNNLNHFSLRSKLYLKAIKAAFSELQFLKAA